MKYITVLFLCLLSRAVSAQIQPDSVLFYQQDRRSVDFASSNATQLISAPYTSVTDNSLSYQSQNGHFRQSQQAESNSAIQFNTNGIKTLGRFKLQGSFSFSRMNEDSLASTMRGLSSDVSPYYFMAIKAGQYSRASYHMEALISYELLPGRLFIASGVDYLYNNTSRSVDPRPSIQTFKMNIRPELVYRSGKNYLGAGVDWGYGNENLTVGFKNSAYATGNTYPERFLYLIQGYGFSDRANERKVNKDYNFSGFRFNYARRTNRLQLGINLSYKRENEDTLFPLDNSENDNLVGSFRRGSYQSRWLLAYRGQKFRQQFALHTDWQDGSDYNVTLGGSNYKYKNNFVKGTYSIMKSHSLYEIVPEVGVTFFYQRLGHRDISAGITVDQQYVQPGLLFNLYKKFRDNNRFAIKLEPSVRLPQDGSITTIPGIFSYFTDNIALPDYSYYNTKAGIIDAEITFLTPHLFKSVTSGLSIRSIYTKALNTQRVDTQLNFLPSGDRLSTSFSFNIYF